MKQYIDKSAVIAEIERKVHNIDYEGLSDRNIGQKQSLYHILSFLDTLEVKEADLYKELDVYFAQFKGLEKSYWNWRIDSINIHAQGIYDFAKHFFELGLKAQKGE